MPCYAMHKNLPCQRARPMIMKMKWNEKKTRLNEENVELNAIMRHSRRAKNLERMIRLSPTVSTCVYRLVCYRSCPSRYCSSCSVHLICRLLLNVDRSCRSCGGEWGVHEVVVLWSTEEKDVLGLNSFSNAREGEAMAGFNSRDKEILQDRNKDIYRFLRSVRCHRLERSTPTGSCRMYISHLRISPVLRQGHREETADV